MAMKHLPTTPGFGSAAKALLNSEGKKGIAITAPPAPRSAPNYYEWCQDHGKALEKAPFGKVASGGPVTLPDSNILTNGF